jgi:hypothetical protein
MKNEIVGNTILMKGMLALFIGGKYHYISWLVRLKTNGTHIRYCRRLGWSALGELDRATQGAAYFDICGILVYTRLEIFFLDRL